MNRSDLLTEAARCVCQERAEQYGDAENGLGAVAALWGAYTGAFLDAHDVAAMMCLYKLARVKTGTPKTDNWVDIAGYAALGGELQAEATQ